MSAPNKSQNNESKYRMARDYASNIETTSKTLEQIIPNKHERTHLFRIAWAKERDTTEATVLASRNNRAEPNLFGYIYINVL